jgi:hypothetical protein
MARLNLDRPVVVMTAMVLTAMSMLGHVFGQIDVNRPSRVARDVLGHDELRRADRRDVRQRLPPFRPTGVVSQGGVESMSVGQRHCRGEYGAPGHGDRGAECGCPSPGQSAEQAGTVYAELPVPAQRLDA